MAFVLSPAKGWRMNHMWLLLHLLQGSSVHPKMLLCRECSCCSPPPLPASWSACFHLLQHCEPADFLSIGLWSCWVQSCTPQVHLLIPSFSFPLTCACVRDQSLAPACTAFAKRAKPPPTLPSAPMSSGGQHRSWQSSFARPGQSAIL